MHFVFLFCLIWHSLERNKMSCLSEWRSMNKKGNIQTPLITDNFKFNPHPCLCLPEFCWLYLYLLLKKYALAHYRIILDNNIRIVIPPMYKVLFSKHLNRILQKYSLLNPIWNKKDYNYLWSWARHHRG